MCSTACIEVLNIYAPRRHLDSDGDGCLSVAELKQALGDLGFGQRAQAAAEDMVREAAGQGVGSIVLADFLQFVRRVRLHLHRNLDALIKHYVLAVLCNLPLLTPCNL